MFFDENGRIIFVISVITEVVCTHWNCLSQANQMSTHKIRFYGQKNDKYISQNHHLSWVMRKPAFSICKSKGADQLCGNPTADQRLCFAIPLLPKSEISTVKGQKYFHKINFP